ncbi:hypothetical protein BDZ91DRAFT_766104 [Kalaharituber pfeilii]|nr:hypothetical protein BDZ91DRAFT_766104 [Kalaharituber pfeilii]
MKLTFESFYPTFIAFIVFLSTTTAHNGPKSPPFRIRVSNDYPWGLDTPPPGPIFNHYGELDPSTAEVIINATAGWKGFESYLDPEPKGSLHKLDNNDWGYLLPLFGADDSTNDGDGLERFIGHFAFQYGPGLPLILNLLFENFTTIERGCGSNCRAATLNYDEGGETRGYGTWYVVPRENGGQPDGVWILRWTNVEHNEVPEGGWKVLVWKDRS